MKVYVVVEALSHRDHRPSDYENRGVYIAEGLARKAAWERASEIVIDYHAHNAVVDVKERDNHFASSKHSIVQYDARYRHENINSWKVVARVWVEEWEAKGSAVDALGSIKEDLERVRPFRANGF